MHCCLCLSEVLLLAKSAHYSRCSGPAVGRLLWTPVGLQGSYFGKWDCKGIALGLSITARRLLWISVGPQGGCFKPHWGCREAALGLNGPAGRLLWASLRLITGRLLWASASLQGGCLGPQRASREAASDPVSYTHLTLPTTPYV